MHAITDKKYELLTTDTISLPFEPKPVTLYRIRALRDIPRYAIKKGDLGGYIQSEAFLSQSIDSNAWVGPDSQVFTVSPERGPGPRVLQDAFIAGSSQIQDNARVSGNAYVHDSFILGSANVLDAAKILRYSTVRGNAFVLGNAQISDFAEIKDEAWGSGDAHITDKLWGALKVRNSPHIKLIRNDFIENPRHPTNHLKRLYRVQALVDIPCHGVKAGDLGGYAQRSTQLHGPASWVADNGMLYGHAVLHDSALITHSGKASGHAQLYNNSKISGSAHAYKNAVLKDSAQLRDNAKISGNSILSGVAILSGNIRL